jgi:hypothetical protein
VNITGITFDASGNGVTDPNTYIIGVLYDNSSGTVNHVATRNQTGNLQGCGVILQGGASNPSVTVENSSIHDFDYIGIFVFGVAADSEVNATLKSNSVNAAAGVFGIYLYSYTASTVSSNYIFGSPLYGIFTQKLSTGSVSGNVLMNNAAGISAASDDVSILTNKILNSSSAGVFLLSAIATVKSNTIVQSPFVAINFNCNGDASAHSNTIIDAGTGADLVPTGLSVANSYYNVSTLQTGGC